MNLRKVIVATAIITTSAGFAFAQSASRRTRAHFAITHEGDILIRVEEPFAVRSCFLLHTK